MKTRTKRPRPESATEGLVRLAVQVWTDGSTLILTGNPPEEEKSHNCDSQGCGCGAVHVLYRARINKCQCRQFLGCQEVDFANFGEPTDV